MENTESDINDDEMEESPIIHDLNIIQIGSSSQSRESLLSAGAWNIPLFESPKHSYKAELTPSTSLITI